MWVCEKIALEFEAETVMQIRYELSPKAIGLSRSLAAIQATLAQNLVQGRFDANRHH
jgi:hypothetical protein